jgi:predicted AlkP superfamily phosphohydrolase/phosphomutase
MTRKTSDKIIVLGIDGMDPRLTRKYVDMGLMPNVKKYIEAGDQRHDLVLLGGHPTVTPSMWTTLATGAYSTVHGITDFYRQNPDSLEKMDYNLDSRLCKAEQLWNVFAEAGKKTLVWHWPGSAWPPSSDSENLHVVDGSSPGGVSMSNSQFESEYLVYADESYDEITFRPKSGNEITPCIIKDLDVADPTKPKKPKKKFGTENVGNNGISVIITKFGEGAGSKEYKFDIAMSPIKPAAKWTVEPPQGTKEFILLLSGGLLRRPCQILKNESGIYDHIAVYKNKKADTPITVLPLDELVTYIHDEGIRNDKTVDVVRHMRLLELTEDGSHLKLFVSAAMQVGNDTLFHPKRLYQSIVDNVACPPPSSMLFAGRSRDLFFKCALASWEVSSQWQSAAIHHLMEQEHYDVIFSHFHNIDIQDHTFYKYMAEGIDTMTPEDFVDLSKAIYQQTDRYLGSYLHLLDEGWTIFIVSDHGLVAHGNEVPLIGDMNGCNVGLPRELGYTELVKDEYGNPTYEIDWTKTKAVANRGCHIYLNVKGRNKHTLADGTVIDGIVDPADKYEVEEQLMTDLYGYKHPKTGKRVIALALRNKDAVLLGLSGPECGDIVYFTAEGYNYDHTDSLSTTYGINDTSSSPIFIACGTGIKKSTETDRWIREVDLAPTMAILGGVRMPHQCEGAPTYQILEDDYQIETK